MLDLGYPPHVTLAVYDDRDIDSAAIALDHVFEGLDRMPVALTDFATFGAGSGVCYAALAPSSDLARLHRRSVAAVAADCRPHYQPGRWTPHCTLATALSDADISRAKDLLEVDWRAVTGMFEIVELIEFAPIVSVRRWRLSAAGPATRRR